MASENSDVDIADAPPKRKFRLTPAVVLILLSSTFFLLLVGVGIFHFQSSNALKAELATTKKTLSEKTALIDKAQAQGQDLTTQLNALRAEITAAKAETAAALAAPPPPAEVAAPCPPASTAPSTHKLEAAASPAASKALPAADEASGTTPDAPPKKKPTPVARMSAAKKAKLVVQDCQLVGKTAEEQAATLQRCMHILDGGR